jgi:predicted metal-binding protein
MGLIKEVLIMGKWEDECFDELVELALKEGAKAAKVIPTSIVAVDERVRLKCEIPRCSGLNRYLTCPPNTMSVKKFSKILSLYKWCLLVQVEAPIDSSKKGEGRIDISVLEDYQMLHKPYKLKLLSIIEAIEGAAFKKGLRFASGLTGGCCVLCDQCVKDKSTEMCRFPFRARPAMEGVGIDVFQTAEDAGLPIHLSSSKNVLWSGLILLD